MTVAIEALAWPASRLGEAIRTCARAGGVQLRDADLALAAAPLDEGDDDALEHAVTRAAAALGVEAEPCGAAAGDVEALLRGAAPALVRVPGGAPRVLVLAKGGFGAVRVIDPDGRAHRVPVSVLRDLVCGPLEARVASELTSVLEAARVPPARRARARRALAAERLADARVEGVFLLRLPPGAPLRAALSRARVPGRTARLLAAHLAEQALFVASFWVLGTAALSGNVDPGWLAAWALLVATGVPLHGYATRAQAAIALDVAAILKRHLLAGALRMDADETRREGAGQTLGRVLESEAVEELALGAGFAAALASAELVAAGVVLAMGASAALEVALLVGFVVAATALGLRVRRARAVWTDERLALTHDTIERMVGHRTRLAQEAPEAWHDGEDQALGRMLDRGRAMDRALTALSAGVPRAWLVASVAALAPAMLAGPRAAGALAVSLGGALLAARALRRVGQGVAALAGAAVSLRRLRPVLAAAARPEPPPSPVAFDRPRTPRAGGALLLDARHVGFRHAGRAAAVLRDASLRVSAGDRVLVEGPSGCGKSTLASVLVGLRDASSGLVLLEGLDRRTLGEHAWRARVAGVPQFHENHLVGASLAFNLLMGRRWPPRARDLEEAEAVCRELALGPLLERMPAGIQQPVGECGWQLSHGERSRVFIARALLQGADVVVLDESFAALDPATIRRAMDCVAERARATVVIAHP